MSADRRVAPGGEAPSRGAQLLAEGVGTALLVAAVLGSGVMAERLSGGNVALALLCNTLATGGALVALILAFAPFSGAHFNPVVSVALAARGALPWRDVPGYVLAQCAGAVAGAVTTHAMFELPLVSLSRHARSGGAQLLSEGVATFGLLAVIFGATASRRSAALVPFAVAGWIMGAYWFTASTSFANPAVTLGRALSDTFAGIRPADVPGFVAAQCAGGAAAVLLFRVLARRAPGGSSGRLSDGSGR
jgi:glycerol uptake facilitator-like aquaporin